jgi:sigma-B regulation protein RsbU (phosphoserine phosphatase)
LNESQQKPTGFPEPPPTDFASVDWQALIDYRHSVGADEPMERVYRRFSEIDEGFMAVVEDGRAIGLCARYEIGMKLGSQYGYSLFARTPVREHLVREPLLVGVEQPWSEVLQRVFSREVNNFNQDVVLVDGEGRLLGLISVRTLVRLQTRLLMQSIAQLEQKQVEISRHNRQLMDDLKMAREMQLAMLPHELPPLPNGTSPARSAVCIQTHYAPLGLVSGDFYEVLSISDTAVGVLIADVMGHGVQAALVTAMVRALIEDHRGVAGDPGAFLAMLNRSLCDILQGSNLAIFASAFALVVDLAEGVLRYANAGHPIPILLRRSRGEVRHLDCEERSNGGLLGVSGNMAYTSGQMALVAQDSILLYSDGLFEIRGAGDEILGQDGLLALVAKRMDSSGEFLVRELVREVVGFSPEGKFEDDVCVVALEIRELLGTGAIGGADSLP